MADVVEVRAFGANGHLVAEGRHALPFWIGRDQKRAQFILADPEVSRAHVQVLQAAGGLTLKDDSLNGTTYQGQTIRKDAVSIRERDSFFVRQFRIEVERIHGSAEPVTFHAAVILKDQERVYSIGPHFLILMAEGSKLRLEQTRPRDPGETLAFYAQSNREAFAVIGVRDGFGTLTTTPRAKERRMTINRGVPAGGTEALRPLDVIMLGRTRIEILKHGERALRCKNVTCELLNPYDITENCKYCGHRLVEAATRLVAG